ncbi:MAG: hypothetical protein AB8G16_06400 [Gammaproteobacteria bacterium]
MLISDTILAAVIAAVVSLVVSVVSTYLTALFARKKFEREVSEKYRQKLYELRLKEYPAAFGITGRVVFDETLHSTREDIASIMADLRTWWVGPAAPLLSRDAVDAYFEFKQAAKRIVDAEGDIDQAASNELFAANKQLRWVLRQDLDVLYDSDEFTASLRRKPD